MDFKCENFMDKLMVILRGIGLIALYMVISPLLLNLFFSTPLKNSFLGKNAGYLLSEVLTTLLLILIFHKRFIRDFKDFKQNYKKYLKIVIPYWVLGFIIMMFSNIIINLIITNGSMAANESANREVLKSLPIYSIIATCFLAPICEELLFRASFKDAFKNIIPYCLFTGLFFAALHVSTGIESWSLNYLIKNWHELLYFIPYGSVGFALGYAFFKTNNIFSSISLHMLHNSLTILFIAFAYITGGI